MGKFCTKCGAPIEEANNICPKCGTKLSEEKVESKVEVKENTNGDNETVMLILSYLSFLCLIPYLTEKQSEKIKFHSLQGLNLFIYEVIFSLAITIISSIIGGILGFVHLYTLLHIINVVFSIITWGINLASVAFTVIGIVNAMNNKQEELPFIGKYKIVKKNH